MFNDKQKFVKYMVEGVPAILASDEVELFYDHLTDYVNQCDNSFSCFPDKKSKSVTIGDEANEYLRVLYEDEKIVFERVDGYFKGEPEEYFIKMGQAWLGVMFFLETVSPTGELESVPKVYHDQWTN